MNYSDLGGCLRAAHLPKKSRENDATLAPERRLKMRGPVAMNDGIEDTVLAEVVVEVHTWFLKGHLWHKKVSKRRSVRGGHEGKRQSEGDTTHACR